MTTTNKLGIGFALVLIVVIFSLITLNVKGEPAGVSVLSNSTDSGPTASYNRADDGGTITTLSLNVSQQSATWKGYVGNITGQIVLQDSSNQTLYDWTLASITGEIYAARASSVTWADIGCANYANISAEYTPLSMVEGDVDSINQTFIHQNHTSLVVAGTTIAQDTCPSIATYINSTSQTVNTTADFQELLLDDSNTLIYTTILEQDASGYREFSTNDFQMIIPDSDAAATQTTYYFWAELG